MTTIQSIFFFFWNIYNCKKNAFIFWFGKVFSFFVVVWIRFIFYLFINVISNLIFVLRTKIYFWSEKWEGEIWNFSSKNKIIQTKKKRKRVFPPSNLWVVVFVLFVYLLIQYILQLLILAIIYNLNRICFLDCCWCFELLFFISYKYI